MVEATGYRDVELKGGVYFAFSTGYEFPFGLIVDIKWSSYHSSVDYNNYIFGSSTANTIYSVVGIGAGYKLKI